MSIPTLAGLRRRRSANAAWRCSRIALAALLTFALLAPVARAAGAGDARGEGFRSRRANRSASIRWRSRRVAFALSALCAGLAGALFAPLSGFVTPSTFAFLQSILFVLVVIDRRRGHGEPGRWSARDRGAAARSCWRGWPSTGCCSSARCCCVVLWIAPEGIVGEVATLDPSVSATPRCGEPAELPSAASAPRQPLQVSRPDHRLRRRARRSTGVDFERARRAR